jgi:D-inositol-3-phosphate glycosyltransferase
VIADLLRTPTELGRLAGRARPHAERFSWDHTADALLAAYREAVEEFGTVRELAVGQ